MSNRLGVGDRCWVVDCGCCGVVGVLVTSGMSWGFVRGGVRSSLGRRCAVGIWKSSNNSATGFSTGWELPLSIGLFRVGWALPPLGDWVRAGWALPLPEFTNAIFLNLSSPNVPAFPNPACPRCLLFQRPSPVTLLCPDPTATSSPVPFVPIPSSIRMVVCCISRLAVALALRRRGDRRRTGPSWS